MTPALCLTSGSTPVVDGVEEAADEPGLEILVEAEIEEARRAGRGRRSRAISAIVRLASPAFSGLTGAATMMRSQLPWNTVPGFGLAQIGAEPVAEARRREHRLQLLAVDSALIGSKAGWL